MSWSRRPAARCAARRRSIHRRVDRQPQRRRKATSSSRSRASARTGMILSSAALKGGAGLAIVSRPTADDGSGGSVARRRRSARSARGHGPRGAGALAGADHCGHRQRRQDQHQGDAASSRLSHSGLTHASAASFNNHWGVPLTLARMQRECAYRRVRDRHEPCGRDHAADARWCGRISRSSRPLRRAISGISPRLPRSPMRRRKSSSGLSRAARRSSIAIHEFFERLAAAARKAGMRADHRLRPPCGGGGAGSNASRFTAIAPASRRDILGETVIYKLGVPGEHHGAEQPCGACAP